MSISPLFPRGGSSGPTYLKGRHFCKIGGIELPGLVSISSPGLVMKVDPKDGAGTHGGHPTLKGLAAQELAVRVVVWTDAQKQAMADAVAALFPWPSGSKVKLDPKKQAVSFDAFYTDDLLITSVIVAGMSPWSESSVVTRGLERTVKLLHWLPALRAVKSAAVATPTRTIRTDPRLDAGGAAKNPAPTARPGIAGP